MRSLLYLFLLSIIKANFAYIITVDSHAEECFFDTAQAASKMGKIWKKNLVMKTRLSLIGC